MMNGGFCKEKFSKEFDYSDTIKDLVKIPSSPIKRIVSLEGVTANTSKKPEIVLILIQLPILSTSTSTNHALPKKAIPLS